MTPDLVNAIADAYECNGQKVIQILVEFVWAARFTFLRVDVALITELIRKRPDFAIDMLKTCGAASRSPASLVWAPLRHRASVRTSRPSTKCLSCENQVQFGPDGLVFDPFTLGSDNIPTAMWCPTCS